MARKRLTSGTVAWIASAITIIALIVADRAMIYTAQRDLEAQISAAKREGIPTNPNEIILPPEPPAAENAWELYRKAVSERSPTTPRRANPDARFDFASPADRAWVHTLYQNNQEAIKLLFEGAAKPHLARPRDSQESLDSFRLRAVVMYVREEARAEAYEGKSVNALRLLAHLSPIGHQFDEDVEPYDITPLGSIGNDGVVQETLVPILRVAGILPGGPEAAQDVLNGFGPLPPVTDEIIRQNLMTQLLIKESQPRNLGWTPGFDDDKIEAGKFNPLPLLVRIPGLRERWQAVEWIRVRSQVAAIRNFHGTYDSLESQLINIDKTADDTPGDAHAYARINDRGRAVDVSAWGMMISRRRVLAEAVAVYAEWQHTGKLPIELPIAGERGQDPFTGKPLGFRTTASGFVVSSSRYDFDSLQPPHAVKR